MAFDWTCSYCGKPTTITAPLQGHGAQDIGTEQSRHGSVRISWTAIACPNKSCKQLSLIVDVYPYQYKQNSIVRQKSIFTQRLLPESSAKPLPDYIPAQISDTYSEACRIVSLSPKASATLSRRCLQGMIRDFWGVTDKPNLFQEIDAIKDRVDPDTWDSIDAVRKIGNIGAHMEKDVNLLVDVDPDEATVLIQLVESLFEDWYIDREKRRARNLAVKSIISDKKPTPSSIDKGDPAS